MNDLNALIGKYDESKARLIRIRFERTDQVRRPFQLDNISWQKPYMQKNISTFSARQRQSQLMIFFLHPLPQLFASTAEYPRDPNRFPLNSLATHGSATTHCSEVSTPKVIYPETQDRPIRVVCGSQHRAGCTE